MFNAVAYAELVSHCFQSTEAWLPFLVPSHSAGLLYSGSVSRPFTEHLCSLDRRRRRARWRLGRWIL